MNARWSRRIATGLAVLCLLTLLVGGGSRLLRDPLADLKTAETTVGGARERVPAAASPDSAVSNTAPGHYLGSAACAECHADLCESYVSHPMSRSMSLAAEAPDPEEGIEAAPFSVPGPPGSHLQFEYGVVRDAGSVGHYERVTDAAGQELCRRTVPMHYAVGSGQRAHSYLCDVGGQHYMSPITWYTGAGSYDLSPGYEKANQHFERRIVDGCIFCHVGRSAIHPTAAHTFNRTPFLELSIGCERCHGPGGDHVEYHHGLANTDLEADPIVNPARLSQPYRDDVCFQCHLQGVTRVVHPGLRDFSYRPGQAIADIWTVFLNGTKISADNTTQAVGQAEQMLASRCYLESEGAMSCTSCHDPHSSPSEETRVEFYRSRCLNCHSSGDSIDCLLEQSQRLSVSAADSCIECHMPKLDANDVSHTSQTDHRVVRSAGGGGAEISADALLAYQSDRLSADLIRRARGLFYARHAEADADRIVAARAIDLLAPWVQANPSDAEAMSELGSAYSLTNDMRKAMTTLEQALAVDPDSEYTLRQLMYLCHDTGDIESGIRYGRRLIRLNPHHYDYHGRMAHMLGQSNRWAEAVDSALKAVEIRPWDARIHGWLAEAYRVNDRLDLAKQHLDLSEKLRSGEPPAER
jgi:predicted CXXCH cytochrome family protein